MGKEYILIKNLKISYDKFCDRNILYFKKKLKDASSVISRWESNKDNFRTVMYYRNKLAPKCVL